MSVLGRGLGFLCGLILLAVGLAGLWIAWGPGSVEIAGRASRFSLQLATEQLTRWIVTAGFAVVSLLALGLIIEAVRPRRPRLIQLHAGEHESVLIAPSELERQLETVARDAERVEDAHAQVHPAGDHSVSVDMALNVEPDAEVGSVVSDVQQRMATALAARYGIAMSGKPKIEVRYAGDREQRARHRRTSTGNAAGQSTGSDDIAAAHR